MVMMNRIVRLFVLLWIGGTTGSWLLIATRDPIAVVTAFSFPMTTTSMIQQNIPCRTSTFLRASSSSSPGVYMVSNLIGRFRKKRQIATEETKVIKNGDRIPSVDVEWVRQEKSSSEDDDSSTTTMTAVATPVSMTDVLGENQKCLLIGMPGAFTPTCTKQHLPGYIKMADKFKESCNIDTIAIVTTNDRFVNEEWCTPLQILSNPMIKILSDGDGDFVKSCGLADDMGFGMGIRSKRFAMVVDKNIVSSLYVDNGMDDCSQTSANNIFKQIAPSSAIASLEENEISTDPIILGAGLALLALALFLAAS
jgi:glutaredoxin/glutathione-dependent peroxiredoxin